MPNDKGTCKDDLLLRIQEDADYFRKKAASVDACSDLEYAPKAEFLDEIIEAISAQQKRIEELEQKLVHESNVHFRQNDINKVRIAALRSLLLEAGEVVEPFLEDCSSEAMEGWETFKDDEYVDLTAQISAVRCAKVFRDKIKDMCHERSVQADKSVSASPLQTPSGRSAPSAPLQTEPVRDAIPNAAVTIDYTNYRGERGLRRIIPDQISFGSNEWHPEPQWLMLAYDCEKKAERLFAVRDIHSWQVGPLQTESGA